MPEEKGDVHPWESVAADLTNWLDTESSWYAEAMRAGTRAPFAAKISQRESLDYYRRKMFQQDPNGQIHYDRPNEQGRNELMNTLGVPGYTQVWQAVRPKQGRRPEVEPEDDDTLSGLPE